MAAGYDKLLDFLLAEVALCGTQGAGSADLFRFTERYYKEIASSPSDELKKPNLGRAFHERVWVWVSKHPDIQITHNGKICCPSLSDFEAAESNATGRPTAAATKGESEAAVVPPASNIRPSQSLLALRADLRWRLTEEKAIILAAPQTEENYPTELSARRPDRRMPHSVQASAAVFDEPPSTTTGPRLYASQNRVWQALTGHGIDLKKVPSMEFALLSIIAAHGAAGITQPDLTQLSNQDKRSVPKRTDELARKGYIVKNPVQAGKIRTSLCIHSKFVSQNHFLIKAEVDDVFQKGTFVVAGFAQLLYNKLGDSGLVPTRDIRTKLGVPMLTWNKRAVQGALIRLDQSGMIKRCRVRKKKEGDSWVTCIRVLRETQPEDIENLGFRRQVALPDNIEESLQDGDADALMKDLELDIDDNDEDVGNKTIDEDNRTPPQWTPDRLLSNIVLETVTTGLISGIDGIAMRDRIIGPFWRRPIESYLSRLTDDWERMQPPHLRHLAIIRDTRTTDEKRFIHYVYRTYGYFKQAVEAGEVTWEGVRKKPTNNKGKLSKHAQPGFTVNSWGFRDLNKKDFVRFNGTASLADVRSAIVDRKNGPRWDRPIAQEIGYQKSQLTIAKLMGQAASDKQNSSPEITPFRSPKHGAEVDMANDYENMGEEADAFSSNYTPRTSKSRSLGLTTEQRIALGLSPAGRLSKSATNQIMAHRRQTGDPFSLPDKIIEEPIVPKQAPLMTKEERIAANLPPRGRLGLEVENRLREERGMPELVKKGKKRKAKNEPAVLTKQQRIALGLNPHGRLHQDFIEALRRERDNDIPLEDSPAVKAYLESLKIKKTMASSANLTEPDQSQFAVDDEHVAASMVTDAILPVVGAQETDVCSPTALPDTLKRKARIKTSSPKASKRQRTDDASSMDQATIMPTSPTSQSESEFYLAKTPNNVPGDAGGNRNLLNSSLNVSRNATPDAALSSKLLQIESAKPKTDEYNIELSASRRLSSGLYVYPSAKRKVARGRPRNGYIAVFRLPRLQEFSWFKLEKEEASPVTSTRTSHQTRNLNGTANQGATDPNPTVAIAPPELPSSSKPLPAVESTNVSALSAPVTSSSTQADAQNNLSDIFGEQQQEGPKNFSCKDQEQTKPPVAASGHLHPALSHGEDVSMLDFPTSQIPHASLSEPAESRILETSTQLNATTNPSPHLRPDSENPQTEGIPSSLQVVAPVPLVPAAQGINPPATETHSTVTLPDGVVGAIGDVGEVNSEPPKPKPRSSGPGISGSQVKFRQAIIEEIIDRCDGVYPLHGEIWRPFSALWDERHGHTTIKKPINSTVFDTLRDMIIKPAFGLKKMAFYVKARNAAGAKQRVMVARKTIPPNDPRVLQLAYNMANNSLEKSHQYFPEQIRGLFDYKSLYVPTQEAPKDESIALDQLYPELEANIRENRLRRKRAKAAQKQLEKAAAKAQNEKVEAVLPRRRLNAPDGPGERRTRLASLNDKNKRYRRAPQQAPVVDLEAEDVDSDELRSPSPTHSDSSDDVPLMSLKSWNSRRTDLSVDDDTSDLEVDESEVPDKTKRTSEPCKEFVPESVSFTHPSVQFHSCTGTFSTNFSLISPRAKPDKKHVRTENVTISHSIKRNRNDNAPRIKPTFDNEFIYSSNDDSDDTSSEDEEEEMLGTQKQKKKSRVSGKRQIGKKLPLPTLLERLTGLTGDPNDPIWKDPKQKHRLYRGKPWSQRKRNQKNRQQKERQYTESFNPIDKFKRMCCTLALASSMSGDDGEVVWSVVEKVYARDKFFNVSKVKKLWSWLHSNMTAELTELVANFQSVFLEAYEDCRIPDIEDPDTYDWAGVVRWVMRTCPYPEMPLPMYRTALDHFAVDESNYSALNRRNWYGKRVADTARTRLQLQHSFVAPMHQPRASGVSTNDKVLKARSWTRANIATPQSVYNANTAHDKLKVLGEEVLVKVVEDYVQHEHLKMRKIKRQLPGRNYTFTKKFAGSYKRPFELADFMEATQVKKELDAIFANDDPDKRFYNVSRSEEDGAVMAILSLLSGGQVKLVPQLPLANNEFGAPLPRLSKWGLCEGDYIHRAIDRNRLFWDVHVVPTSDYKFGSPLKPFLSATGLSSKGTSAAWSELPEPPLPGKSDPNALLPIWSSVDGKSVTWPWWYRILNIVLQPLFLRPGATAADVYSHCAENATELFEVQLVLDWLSAVGAVTSLSAERYQITPNFWAAFGDALRDTEDDWFGEHVKRKTKMTLKQQWRDQYNLKFSRRQALGVSPVHAGQRSTQGAGNPPQTNVGELSEQIVKNSKAQYSIVKESLLESVVETGQVDLEHNVSRENAERMASTGHAIVPSSAVDACQIINRDTVENGNQAPAAIGDNDTEMVDVEAEGNDIDAEGEMDDGLS